LGSGCAEFSIVILKDPGFFRIWIRQKQSLSFGRGKISKGLFLHASKYASFTGI